VCVCVCVCVCGAYTHQQFRYYTIPVAGLACLPVMFIMQLAS